MFASFSALHGGGNSVTDHAESAVDRIDTLVCYVHVDEFEFGIVRCFAERGADADGDVAALKRCQLYGIELDRRWWRQAAHRRGSVGLHLSVSVLQDRHPRRVPVNRTEWSLETIHRIVQ